MNRALLEKLEDEAAMGWPEPYWPRDLLDSITDPDVRLRVALRSYLTLVTTAVAVPPGRELAWSRNRSCRRGHAWREANTYVRSDGRRECRICRNDRENRRRSEENACA